MNYSKHLSTKTTPQSEPIPGSGQVENSAGGYAWDVTPWTRLDRFLVLGSEGGSYYASEKKLTKENAESVLKCLKEDGVRVVRRIAEISDQGRAPKNDPAIFALALAAGLGDEKTRKAALEVLPTVCRIGTHLFTFLEDVQQFRGWGRGLRSAVGSWYNAKSPDQLAYQILKYRQRKGWTHRDALRLASPKPATADHNAIFRYITHPGESGPRVVRGAEGHPSREYPGVEMLPGLIRDFERLQETRKGAPVKEAINILEGNPSLTWEMVPTKHLGHKEVWATLLPHLPMTALIRNLGRMTANGLITPLSKAVKEVAQRLTDSEAIRKARVHPIAVLAALATYKEGHGARGNLEWKPVSQVTDALDRAFYLAFGNVKPSGKRLVLALDVSSSMDCGEIAGIPGLTPRMASAAMAMITAAVEPEYHIMAFCDKLVPLNVSPRQRLDDLLKVIKHLTFGGTDCALPMIWATEQKVPADGFVVYTDSETWAGDIHPSQALRQFRRKMDIQARLITVGMAANEFSIADPNDPGMLDVVGFDTAAPNLISDFVAGH